MAVGARIAAESGLRKLLTRQEDLPPVVGGVGPSQVVTPVGPWNTLLEFLVNRFPAVGEAEWRARFERGEIRTDEGIQQEQARFRPACRIFYYRKVREEVPIPGLEEVLYQDEHLVVADKPPFLPVVPSGRYVQETLLVRLKRKLGIDDLSPAHRIDRDTQGLVLFVVRPSERGAYQALFRDRRVEKTYEAIAPWRDGLPEVYESRLVEGDAHMQMMEVAGAPNAVTDLRLLERLGDRGRYQLRPKTGQKHQLRAHMAALGIPIENDRIYPVLGPLTDDDLDRPLQLLSKELVFEDAVTGEPRRFESRRVLRFFT